MPPLLTIPRHESRCGVCNQPVDDDAPTCPDCGEPVCKKHWIEEEQRCRDCAERL
jgi:hypothetical protein